MEMLHCQDHVLYCHRKEFKTEIHGEERTIDTSGVTAFGGVVRECRHNEDDCRECEVK